MGSSRTFIIRLCWFAEKNLMREGDLVSKDINTLLRSYVAKLAHKTETEDGIHPISFRIFFIYLFFFLNIPFLFRLPLIFILR
jgi:hypothetical protein